MVKHFLKSLPLKVYWMVVLSVVVAVGDNDNVGEKMLFIHSKCLSRIFIMGCPRSFIFHEAYSAPSVRVRGQSQQMEHLCNECKSTGESINDKDWSTQCKGEKVLLEKKVLEVHVEKHVQNGQKRGSVCLKWEVMSNMEVLGKIPEVQHKALGLPKGNYMNQILILKCTIVAGCDTGAVAVFERED
ncbi:hypothetical protein Tco_0947493 [Tanacetum coccineum]